MKVNSTISVVVIVFVVLTLTACGSTPRANPPTVAHIVEQPTYSPYPSQTPIPIYTQIPTATPTLPPVPTITTTLPLVPTTIPTASIGDVEGTEVDCDETIAPKPEGRIASVRCFWIDGTNGMGYILLGSDGQMLQVLLIIDVNTSKVVSDVWVRAVADIYGWNQIDVSKCIDTESTGQDNVLYTNGTISCLHTVSDNIFWFALQRSDMPTE